MKTVYSLVISASFLGSSIVFAEDAQILLQPAEQTQKMISQSNLVNRPPPVPVCDFPGSGETNQTWTFQIDGKRAFSGATYERAYGFACGLARVRKSGRYGFIDMRGHMVVPCTWSDARDFREGVAAVREGGVPAGPGGKWGYIRSDGSIFIAPSYDYAGDFHEGRAVVNLGGKLVDLMLPLDGGQWGFVLNSGSILSRREWQETRPYSEGLAPVRIRHLWGFVDHRGELRIAAKYTHVSPFRGGISDVQEGDGVFDGIGKLCIDGRGNRLADLGWRQE